MLNEQKKVAVFCASATGADPQFETEARKLGQAIAEAGLGLVYGGATAGLMGVIADSALAAGGEVIGVLPENLIGKERAHRGLTKLHLVDTMHERKALMAKLSDAFVALPGGYGTMDEFMEIVTWAQLRIHQKPCILVNTNGYYDHLLLFLDEATSKGLIKPTNRGLIQVAADTAEVMALLTNLGRQA